MIEEYNNIEQKSFPPCIKCGNHINVKLIINSEEVEISCQKCNVFLKVSYSDFKKQIDSFHQYKQYCERDKSHSSIKGSYYCSSCNDYLCKDCAEEHKKKISKVFHNTVLLDDYRVTKCKVHHKKATFYCITCKDYLCDACSLNHTLSHDIIRIEEINTYYNFLKSNYSEFKNGYKKYMTDLYEATVKNLEEIIKRLDLEYKKNLRKSEEIFNYADFIVESYDTCCPNYQDYYNAFLNTRFSFTPFKEYPEGDVPEEDVNFVKYHESIISYLSSQNLFLKKFEENSLKDISIDDGFLTNNISFCDCILLCFLEEKNELLYFDKDDCELCVYSLNERCLLSELKTDFSIIRSVCKVSDDLVLITNQKGIFLIQIQDSIKMQCLISGNHFHQTILLFDNRFASTSIKSSNNYSIEIFKTKSSFISLFSTSNIFSKESKTGSLFSSDQKTNSLFVKHKNKIKKKSKITPQNPQGRSIFDTSVPCGGLFGQPSGAESLFLNSQSNRGLGPSESKTNLFNSDLLKRIEEMSIFILGTKDNKYIGSITSNEIHFWNIKSYSCDGVIKNIECDNKSTMIEIEDNKLIIQGELSLYIINYLTFQIETIFQINKFNNKLFSRPSQIKIRSMSILNCKDIIIFTEDKYLIRISTKTFTQIKKSFRSLINFFGDNKVTLGQKPSYIINLNDGSQRNIVCSSLPSVIEIYSTLNFVEKDCIKKIQL